MRSKFFLCSLIFLVMFCFFMLGFSEPTEAAADDVIKFASHTVGTGGYVLTSLIAEAIMEKFGITVRSIPSGSEVGRTKMLLQGEADAEIFSSSGGWVMQEGLFNFGTRDMGPQPIRYLWLIRHSGMAMAVSGNSDIYQIADLKGKKVNRLPPSPGQDVIIEGNLAYGGLTWDDVVSSPPLSGPAEAYDYVVTGKSDATVFNIISSKASELASMPGGIRYLEVPPTDTEGWKRLREIAPFILPRLSSMGANISEEKPIWTMTMGYPVFICMADLDEDIAYKITKYINESYPLYSQRDDSLKLDSTIDLTLSLFEQDVAPMHRGAVRYFKEIGKWSEEDENINQKRIERQEKLKELWDSTINEAEEKGIKEENFTEFWMKKRAGAGM